MARIYIVRHGESIANTMGIYQGQTYDTALSPLGKKQARALGLKFQKITLERIIASPVKRTRQTAKFPADLKGLRVRTEPAVIETNHGKWEGRSKEEIMKNWPDIYNRWFERPAAVVFPGGEAFVQTKRRILNWWKKAMKYEGNTLLVTHDNIARILIAEILGLDLNSIWKFDLQPTAVTVVEVKDGKARIVCLNDIGHLNKLETDVAMHAL